MRFVSVRQWTATAERSIFVFFWYLPCRTTHTTTAERIAKNCFHVHQNRIICVLFLFLLGNAPRRRKDRFFYFFHLSCHATHTTAAERRAEQLFFFFFFFKWLIEKATPT